MLLASFESFSQDDSCKILRDTFKKVNANKPPGDSTYYIRFPLIDIIQLHRIEGVKAASFILRRLQSALEIDRENFLDEKFHTLKDFDAEFKMISDLKTECPTISLIVYEDELAYYSSKYREYDEKKEVVYKRKGY